VESGGLKKHADIYDTNTAFGSCFMNKFAVGHLNGLEQGEFGVGDIEGISQILSEGSFEFSHMILLSGFTTLKPYLLSITVLL
jgi:hypothetical protein